MSTELEELNKRHEARREYVEKDGGSILTAMFNDFEWLMGRVQKSEAARLEAIESHRMTAQKITNAYKERDKALEALKEKEADLVELETELQRSEKAGIGFMDRAERVRESLMATKDKLKAVIKDVEDSLKRE